MFADTIKYLTKEETERFFAAIQSKRDKALFSLMYFYGLRCIEASWLTIDDVRLRDDRLYVRAAKQGKSGEQVLTKRAKHYLKAYLEERLQSQKLSDALFLSRKSGALTPTQIYRLFSRYAMKAKLSKDKRHPHILRHSIAVHMADSGVDVGVVKEHLRHRKITTTMIYFELTNKGRLELQARALTGKYIANI